MIFIFDQKGNSKATIPSGSLHQGSNLADEIIVLAPISPSSVVTMSARLPNGLYVYPVLAENGKDPIALEKLETDEVLRDPAGIVYSAFRILVPAPMTQYAGILTVQFTFTMANIAKKDENGVTLISKGQTVTTTALSLVVEPGTPILAPTYTKNEFENITKYLNAALTAQGNAEASADNAAKSEGNAADSASAAGKSAEEAKQWAIAAENRNLNLRNGEKLGSLVQVAADAEKAQKEPTRDHQVLLGENPPANPDDLLEVGRVFGVRQDGTVYAKGEPKDPEDLIRRCDAPPLIEPEEKGGASQIYGVYAKSDSFPNGKQTAFPSSPSVIKKGWIPFRSEYGDLLVPLEPHADNAAASKEFVNSSIATNTATFRGTFDLTEGGLNELPWQEEDPNGEYYVKNNDYAFLYQSSPSTGSHRYIRYKWVASTGRKGSFVAEYELNSSGFTAAQWNAINSGITKGEILNLWSGIGEKLDLIPPPERNQLGRIYCVFAKDDIDPNGRQGYLRFSANGVVEGIVPTRNKGGNILVPDTPRENDHATSKGYVDRNFRQIIDNPGKGYWCYMAYSTDGKTTHQGKVKYDGSAVPYILAARVANGQLTAPNQEIFQPSEDQYVSRRYVDSKMGSGSYADTAAYWKVTSANELKISKGEWTSTPASPGLMHIGHTWAGGSDASIRAYRFGNGGGGTAGLGAKWLDLGGTENTNKNEVGALYGVKKICSTNKDAYLSFEEDSSNITFIVPSTALMCLGSSTFKFLNVYAEKITATSGVIGTATKANALTSSAGSASEPVYFEGGKPKKCAGTTVRKDVVIATGTAYGYASSNTIKVWFPSTVSIAANKLMALATYVYDDGENKQVSVSAVTASTGLNGTAGFEFTIAIYNPPAKAFNVNWVVMEKTIQ